MRTTLRNTSIAAVLLSATGANAADLSPITKADIRSMEMSAAYTGPSTVAGIEDPTHVLDGIAFTSWVGGTTEPVTIEVAFTGTRYVGGLGILPGCAGSNRTFGEFGRPTVLRIKGGDRVVDVRVEDRRRFQDIVIDPPIAARAITITVVESAKGRLPGVCVTDLELREQTALSSLSDSKRETLEAQVAAFADSTKADAAVRAVVQIGPAALPRLSMALTSPDIAVQKHALEALEMIGSPLAAEGLLRYWTTDPGPETRQLALRALAKCGDERALPVLAATMTVADLDMADAAAKSIGAFGSSAVPLLSGVLGSLHEDVKVRALSALAATRDPRALSLALPYLTAARSPVRAAAVRAVAGARLPESIGHLTKMANDPHPVVRLTVAKALAPMREPAATALLAVLMRDRDELVARIAVNRMARRPDGDRQLANYLGEPIAPLGDHAISLLANAKSNDSLRLMIDALRRGEQRYRRSLREGLVRFGRPGLEAVLSAALTDPRLLVDAEAILGDAGEVAVPLILAALRAQSDEPPAFLVRAAGRTGSAKAMPALDLAWKSGLLGVRIEVMRACGSMPGEVVEARVLEGLASSEPAIRAEAVVAVGKAHIAAAAPALVAGLKTRTLPAEHVIAALAALGDGGAEGEMMSAFWGYEAGMEVRLAVLHACKRMQTAGCQNLIARAGSHPNADVRAIALRLIAVR